MRLAGTLLVRACDEIVEKARRIVADQFESTLDDVIFSDGMVRHLPTGDALDVFAVASLAELGAAADLNARIPAFPTGCAVCEVEVDPQTGEVRIVDYTQVDDVGQAINPLIVDGQVHGGIAQGVGGAFYEDLGIDGDGALRAGTLMEYAVPRALDLPPIRVELTEDPTASNPLRVKGAGESGTTPAPAAAISALVDALHAGGIEHIAMPATAPRIWEAIT
jgi:carbon-monoxide dehydrogenase large subunit